MTTEDIIRELSKRLSVAPQRAVFVVTAHDVIVEIANFMGEQALDMDTLDLAAVCHEVGIAFDHDLDTREFIQPCIDAWKIVKNL